MDITNAKWKYERKYSNEDYEAVNEKMGSWDIWKDCKLKRRQKSSHVWKEMLRYVEIIPTDSSEF